MIGANKSTPVRPQPVWAAAAVVLLALAFAIWAAPATSAATATATTTTYTDWTDFSGGCLQPASLKKGETLVFTSPARVLKAIERHERDRLANTCGAEFDEAFARLKLVLHQQEVLADVCGQEAYERLRAFHQDFIHFYVPELGREQLLAGQQHSQTGSGGWFSPKRATADNSNEQEQPRKLKPIPAALRQFFINFAKQINAQCKQRLVNKLEMFQANRSLVNSEDFAVIAKYRAESDRLKFLYELTKTGRSSYGRDNKNEFNELELIDYARVPTLKSSHGGDDDDDGAQLFLQVPFDDRLKRIKEACRKRFMPIYMELFAPVIRLNNLGYVDRTNSKHEDERLETGDNFALWYTIIQTCEVLRDIEILHDASAQNALVDIVLAHSHLAERAKKRERERELKEGNNNNNNHQLMLGHEIKLLSRQQAQQLLRPGQELVRPLYDPREARVSHEPVALTERMWLTKQPEVGKQVVEFEQDLTRTIKWKTSLMRTLKEDLSFQLRLAFRVGKRQVLEKDETAALGRMVAFLNRHQHLIRGFGMVMSIVMICVMAG